MVRDPHTSTADYGALLKRIQDSLVAQPDKPDETPEATLRALYLSAAGKPTSARVAINADLPDLDSEASQVLLSLVERRCSGIPLAHLTGRQSFMGIEMLAGDDALIPRIETEILGYEALWIARGLVQERGPITILDICTGAGGIALGIAAHESLSTVFGSDLSIEAVGLAKDNARHLGLEHRADFRQGDLFEKFDSDEFLGKADMVTCNPPYISSANVTAMHPEISGHEPRMAFDGGALGVTVLRRLIREAHRFLKPESYLCFEVGLGQGNAMMRALKGIQEYREVRTVHDAGGNVRTLVAKT